MDDVLKKNISMIQIQRHLLIELKKQNRLNFDTLLILLQSGLRFTVKEVAIVVRNHHDLQAVFPLLHESFLDERNRINGDLVRTLLEMVNEQVDFPSLIKVPEVFDHLRHSNGFLLLLTLTNDKKGFFKLLSHLIVTYSQHHLTFLNATFEVLAQQDQYLSEVIKLFDSVPGFAINGQLNDRGYTALHAAVLCYSVLIIRQVLAQAEIDPNLLDCCGESTLHKAVRTGHDSTVQQLLDHPKVDSSLITSDGRSVLHIAVAEGKSDVVQLLLDHPKVKPNPADNLGSALYTALVLRYDQAIKILFNHPKFVRTLTGSSAFQISITEEFLKLVTDVGHLRRLHKKWAKLDLKNIKCKSCWEFPSSWCLIRWKLASFLRA